MTCRFCGARALARYLLGWCCPDHTPAALAGRPEPPTPSAADLPPSRVPAAGTYGRQTVGPGDVSRFHAD